MKFKKSLVLMLVVFLTQFSVVEASAEEAGPPGLRLLTEEELTNWEFDNAADHVPPNVEDLTLGDQFILGSMRNEIEDLVIRRLGVTGFDGSKADLRIIQRVIDEDIIDSTDLKTWQTLGVILGDVLARELDLHWVRYEDERGASKALRYRKSLNFVFPVTMLSRRVQFNQPLDVAAIYNKVSSEVTGFVNQSTQFNPTNHYENRSILEFNKTSDRD